MIAGHEVVKMVAQHGLGGKGVLDACAIVVEPHVFCGLALLEEEHVGLDALGIEDACGQAENGVQIEVLQQLLADGFTSIALKQHVVWQHHSSTTRIFQQHHDMLQEVELVVLGLDKEVWTIYLYATLWTSAKRWVGKDDIDQYLRLLLQRVFTEYRTALGAYAVQIEVHRCQRHYKCCVVVAMQRLLAQEIALGFVLRLVLHIVVGCQQEAASATSRVAHSLANLRTRHVDHSRDERARREVLACATLLVLTVLFEDTLIDGTFHIALHHHPLLFINQRDNLAQIDRLVNLVLCLDEDSAYQVVFLAQLCECFLILVEQVETI